MPFQDLPCQGERSAPILNITHPLSIKRYFDRLEFLFLKHSISDTQEKKLAAVMYHSEAEIEELWRTAFAFSDPTCSYEDFKEEIIELYPEVEAAQPTLEELETLVAARTHSQIRSEQELGEYNRKFITISRFLISKNRLGLAEQERYFFAGFEPVLAMAVRSRLKRILPNHLPADPYKVEDIYKAALYILRWQRHAPCVQVPWILSPAFPTPATPATAIPTLLQQVSAFPLAPQSPSPAQPDPVAAVHKTTWKCLAPLISALRDEPRASTAIPVTSIPISLLPPAAHLFQPALQFGQADIPTSTPIECSIVSAQPLSNKAKPLTAQRTEAKNPVKKAPLQLTCVPEEEEARPEKRPQGPVPIIEAHGPAEPSGIASEVLGSPSEDPTAQTSFSGPEYGIDRPKHQPAPIPIIEAHGPAAPSGIAPEVLGSPSEDLTAPPSFSGVECSILRPKHHSAPASVIETHSDCEARIVTASISNTTDNPSSVSDPSSTCDPTCKIPSVPPGLSIGITPSTSALEAHTLAIPSEVSFSTRITLWLLVLLAGYASLSLSVHSLISTNVQVSTPLSTYSDSASSITKVPPPSSVFASIPHPASISPSISDPICIPPLSMRFSVSDPECPQLANQVPNTPKAIRSRPRWPRSQVSQLVSVHMRQRAQRPPQASSHTPLPYFLYFIGRCDERHSAEPSDNWLTTRCRETAWKLLFHPRKPPDIVQAAPTIFGHAHMTEDSHFFSWEENQVPDGMKVISTRIGIDQIVTLNACDTLGRSLRLRQYPPLTKCFAFDPGGPDHGPGWSQFRPQGISSGETELQQQCVQQRGLGFTRSDSRQVITSPGQLSAMAQSRDCSRFARRLRTVSLISSSAYKSRGIVHKEAQGNIIRSTSAWMGLRPQGLSNYATFTRTSAARPKFGDGLRYLRHHLQPPQQRAQEARTYLTKSDMQHRVAQERVQWQQCQHHTDIGSLYEAPDKVYVPAAIRPRLAEARMAGATPPYHKSNIGEVPRAHEYQPSHHSCADLSGSARRKERYHAPTNKFATSATARRQPRQPSFMKNSTHQDTSSAGKFATTPQSRGFPSFGRRLRMLLLVGSSTYKSRGIVHKGAKGIVDRSTSAQMGVQAQVLSNCTTVTRTSAARPKIGDGLQYFRHHLQPPQRRVQEVQVYLTKSDMYHRVPQEQVQRRQHQHSADLDSSAMRKEHHHAPTIKFATSAVARRQPTQLGFTRSSILRATSIIVHFTAMPTAPQSRGLSIFDRVLRAISHVYRSDYRFRSDMHEGMQYRLVRSTSAKIRAQVRGFRGSAICARTPAALPKIGKSRQYLQQRFLFPRRRAQDPRISFGKSSQEQLGIVTRVASTSVPQACGCSRHVLRPTTARGDHNNKYNNHSDLRSTCRPTRQKRHKPRSLGKYKYSSNCTGIAQTSAVYASVWTGSRSRQQCFQGAQVCAQQEQLSDRRRSLRAALPRFATLVHCCTTIARTSAARLGDDDDHAFKRTHFQLPRHHARQIRLDPKYQHSSADPDGLHCPQGFPRHQSTSNPYCPVLPSALFLRAPMTEDSQDLSWERIIRPVHGWPGKVPLWSLSRTAPAARSIPTLRPTLSSFPRFGRLSALSHASAASAYYNYIPFGYPLWFGYLASVVPYIPYTLD
ncbi:hypothetical protein BJY52DRAFT_1190790 [Lactarius psammicola]|nr:hypothetical protein BJY52DRAFT_1190790 [Lactarius psammicola]